MGMRCRHTVPDWHRYVAAGEVTRPVLAACRLLIKEGEPAADARTIACSFWGRQRECPFYDGPEPKPTGTSSPTRQAGTDAPVECEHVWPVRQPGAVDGQRVLLMVLGGLSIALLGWAALLGAAVLLGRPVRNDLLIIMLAGSAVSALTHFLMLLRLWVKR
jgi:hypothetical protein